MDEEDGGLDLRLRRSGSARALEDVREAPAGVSVDWVWGGI